MRLLTSAFLPDSIDYFFYMQYYISVSFSNIFFLFLFLFHPLFLKKEDSPETLRLIRFHYNPHSTVRFHFNTPYKKYLLNCKRFKRRKEMMRKNCNSLARKSFKIFSILSFYHIPTLKVYYWWYWQPISSVHWYFGEPFSELGDHFFLKVQK